MKYKVDNQVRSLRELFGKDDNNFYFVERQNQYEQNQISTW